MQLKMELEIVKWLEEVGCPLNQQVLFKAAVASNSIEILEWLKK
jgi:hypothetical protein